MKLTKPSFWKKKNFITFFLFPLSLITFVVNIYKKLFPQKIFKLKTICVGNIYIGGTGKTSLVIEIYKFLKKKYKIVFIKKKYKNQRDEINLLKNRGNVISNNSRIESLYIAQQKKYSIAILDDGLQQKNIKYDIKIACFNSEEGFGNGYLLPAGPLREAMYELKNYDIVFLNGDKKNKKISKDIKNINKKIRIFEGNYVPENLEKLNRNKNFLMFCGLGNPHEFERTLTKYKFKVKKKIIFPDHYKLSNKEFYNLKILAQKKNLNIITTEKDYIRLNSNQKKNVDYLKIKLKINKPKELEKFIDKIL